MWTSTDYFQKPQANSSLVSGRRPLTPALKPKVPSVYISHACCSHHHIGACAYIHASMISCRQMCLQACTFLCLHDPRTRLQACTCMCSFYNSNSQGYTLRRRHKEGSSLVLDVPPREIDRAMRSVTALEVAFTVRGGIGCTCSHVGGSAAGGMRHNPRVHTWIESIF